MLLKGVLLIFFICILTLRQTRPNSIEKFMEFIHIPKNAGTAIENVAKEKGVRWGRFKPEHREFMDENICNYWHIPPKRFKEGNFYQRDDSFCVIRNPFSRIISEYAYRHSNQPKKNNAKDLNDWIEKVLTKDNVNTKGGMDCHLFPQHDYVYDDVNDVYTCHNILRFEHLEDDFNDLMKKENYDLKLNKKDNTTNFGLTEKQINSKNRALITTLYARDFELWEKNLP
mgnify:CR=1 FL=1